MRTRSLAAFKSSSWYVNWFLPSFLNLNPLWFCSNGRKTNTADVKATREALFHPTNHQRADMNQQCKVCGEPAAGFHFGAFTCEGCKVSSPFITFETGDSIIYDVANFDSKIYWPQKCERFKIAAWQTSLLTTLIPCAFFWQQFWVSQSIKAVINSIKVLSLLSILRLQLKRQHRILMVAWHGAFPIIKENK